MRHVAIGILVLLGCCEAFGYASQQGLSNAHTRILGAWQLESRTVRGARGETLDPVLGKQPLGRLFYDASGRMSLQMMRQGRAQAITTPSNPGDANNQRVVLGYDSYFGTFQLNESAGTITHHVEGSLFPEDLGKDFVRSFSIDGNTFTLSFTSRTPDGSDVTRTLRFRRLK
jgi:lipocalin-like protein